MALINVKKIKYVSKKINLEEEVSADLKLYVKFLNLEVDKEDDNESLVINKALEFLFSKDKEFKDYKNKTNKSKANNDTNNV